MPTNKPTIRLLHCAGRRDLSVLDIHVHAFPQAHGEAEIQLRDEHSLCLFSTATRSYSKIGDGHPIDIEWPANSFSFIPAGLHAWHRMPEPHDRTLIRIPRRRFDAHAQGHHDGSILHPLVAQRDPVIASAAAALSSLATETATPATPTMVDGLASTIVARIWQIMVEAAGTEPASLPAPRMRRVLEYIEGHIGDDVDLATLAGVAALSPFHFNRAFSNAMGVSPMRYVLGRRVDCAKRLLRNGTIPLITVAHDCGFANQSHFTTAFKRATGQTPAAWRRANLS